MKRYCSENKITPSFYTCHHFPRKVTIPRDFWTPPPAVTPQALWTMPTTLQLSCKEVCCPEGLRNKAQNCNCLGASRQKGSPRKNTVTPKPKYFMEDFFFPQNSSAFYHKTWNKYLQLPSLAWFWLLGFAEMTWNINFQMYFLLGYLASWGQQIRGLDAFADPLLTSKQNSCMFW